LTKVAIRFKEIEEEVIWDNIRDVKKTLDDLILVHENGRTLGIPNTNYFWYVLIPEEVPVEEKGLSIETKDVVKELQTKVKKNA
jgi:hypothetical protein